MLSSNSRHATEFSGGGNQTHDERIYMSGYHDGRESILIIYDLADPAQWSLAGQCVRCWGRERVVIHSLDAERVVVEFRPGGVAELRNQEPA